MRQFLFYSLLFSIFVSFCPVTGIEKLFPQDGLTCETFTATHYTAAVVEYKPIPIGNQTAEQAVLNNVKEYIKLMQEAHNQNADIIVFPEYGVTTIALPAHRELAREFFTEIPPFGTVPCDNSANRHKQMKILYELSCAAQQFALYTVVNLGEVEPCDENEDTQCPTDGAYHYNTNVVFDRNGAIIARYRKFHLYFEPQFNYPEIEYSTFVTDFEVEFGLFTCFDIIFANPAVELVATKNIRNFVFPTAWIDELPFLMAIQAQSLFAQSNNANLLASGYHQPDRGSMGSGIYSGHRGALNYVFNASSGTKVVISSVPVTPENDCESIHSIERAPSINQEAPYHLWLREDLLNCSHKPLDPRLHMDSLCHDEQICCDVEYDLTSTEYTGSLKLLAFDGRRTVAAKRDWFEWQVCAILHCVNETLESCTEIQQNYNYSHTINHPRFTSMMIRLRPVKTEYAQEGVAEPALSLLDMQFNLIPQHYFNVRKWNDATSNTTIAEAKTNIQWENSSIDMKTVSLIQKVYKGRL